MSIYIYSRCIHIHTCITYMCNYLYFFLPTPIHQLGSGKHVPATPASGWNLCGEHGGTVLVHGPWPAFAVICFSRRTATVVAKCAFIKTRIFRTASQSFKVQRHV